MIPRKSPIRRNQRRSGAHQRRGKDLLEVTIRSRLASQQRNRRMVLWTCKLLLLVAAVGASVYGGREALNRYFWQNPKYRIAVVEINNAGNGVTREMVLSATGLEVGKHIFGVSLSKARKALLELPQIENAELSREMPNRVLVRLTERHPVAWLADPDAADPMASEKSYLVDSHGTLFKPKRQLPEYLRLPVIHGAKPENYLPGEKVATPEVQAALELIARNNEAYHFALESIDVSKGYCLVASNSRGREYIFPLDRIDMQLERFSAALEHASQRQQEIQTINLLVERNVPVTYVKLGAEAPPAPAAKDTPKTASKPPERTPEKEAHTAKAEAAPAKTPARRTTPSVRRAQPARAKPAPTIRRAEPVIRRALPVRAAAPMAAAVAP